jgi:phage terminase small subunit
MAKLTDKQKAFCVDYILHWNATKAAINAGYSEKTAHSIGHENLRKPEIAEYIEEIQEDIEKLAGISMLGNAKAFLDIANDETVKPTDRVKARVEAGKILGHYEKNNAQKKNENTTNINIQDWVDGTSSGTNDMDNFEPKE